MFKILINIIYGIAIVFATVVAIPFLIQLGINSGNPERILGIGSIIVSLAIWLAIFYLVFTILRRKIHKLKGITNPPLSKTFKVISLIIVGYLLFIALLYIGMGGLSSFF